MEELAEEFHGAAAMALHGLTTLPFWLALAGVVAAYVFYLVKPAIPAAIAAHASAPSTALLENKYYMDWFNETCSRRRRARPAPACGRAATRP